MHPVPGFQIIADNIVKQRYTQVNAEFKRKARRDKAFLTEQHKKIEESNTMTRFLFKKIGDTKGTLHAKMGTIKDRDIEDLTEAENMNKRQQEYTEELYKKGLNELHNPQWCGHSSKAWSQVGLRKHCHKISGGNEIPDELFQILKNDGGFMLINGKTNTIL